MINIMKNLKSKLPLGAYGGISKVLLTSLFTLFILCVPGKIYGADIFADLTKIKNVESTYVSGKFSHNVNRWNSRSGTHSMDLSRGFSALYTYQCWSQESVDLAQKLLKDYLSKNKDVELMMHKKDSFSEYKVYEKFNKDNKVTQMIIWNCEAPNLCEIVVVEWKEGLDRSTSFRNTLRPLAFL